MGELWDIYDENKMKTGRYAEREKYKFKEGEYHIVVIGIIVNSEKKILINKRAPHKQYGLKWEFSGGSILKGETSLDGIIRELKEETGIRINQNEAIFFQEIKDNIAHDYMDIWIIQKDINIKDITFPDKEAIESKWVTINEFMEIYDRKEFIPTINFGINEYEEVLNKIEETNRE